MTKSKFSITAKDPRIQALMKKADHKTLGVWARDCAERVMPHFERQFPRDARPRNAIETLEVWIKTGEFRMAIIRGASLASHAAAREVGEDSPARSAARAAGQAVAAAHVPTHSLGAANYALQAVQRAAEPEKAEVAVKKERDWQLEHLRELKRRSES